MKPSLPFSSRRGGIIRKTLVTLVVLAAFATLAWIIFLPRLVKREIASLSGFPTEAKSISGNPFGASVRVEELTIHNPAQFPVQDFVTLKLLDMQVKPFSLMGSRVDIPRLHLDLEKITLVTNKDGVTNATVFKDNAEKNSGYDPNKPSKETPFFIGDLIIRVGSIETIDYSKGETPVKRTFNLGIDRHFTNVSDAKTIAGPIVADIVAANVSGLTGDITALLPAGTNKAFGDALKQATGLLPGLLRGDSDLFKNPGQTIDAAKKLLDNLRGNSKP